MSASHESRETKNITSDAYRTEDLNGLPYSSNDRSWRTATTASTDEMSSIHHHQQQQQQQQHESISRSSLIVNDTSKTGTLHHDHRQHEIEGTQSSYRSSLLRSGCTFQNFCYCVQFFNCILVCLLVALAVQEYPKIEALEEEVQEEQAEMDSLQEEVREKQEGQIEELNQQVADEQQFNFLTLAGTFTLITCLISMFHMSTHLQKMNQPIIQRKIIAMLWMSPIYSVTSFLTLWFPSIGGWMAIIKDFYEAYCIYTFLSFLIAVLGHGDRDQAVDVLAKHAPQLERPTRCLGCFYEPPPEASDHAKANAVLTQCQIYCLQFTFLRPITTIIYVLMHDEKEEGTSENDSNSSEQETTSFDAEDDNNAEDGDGEDDKNDNNNTTGTRGNRWLQQVSGRSNETTINNDGREDEVDSSGTAPVPAPTAAIESSTTTAPRHPPPSGSSSTIPHSPTTNTDSKPMMSPPTAHIPSLPPAHAPSPLTESFATLAPSVVSGIVGTLVPSLAPIAGAITGPISNTTDGLGDNNDGIPDEDSSTDDFVESTKAYFQSPAFVLAMIVNVSVIFAFTGLLKFYHAVRDDLKWCRPWPKFLTIKGVVFVTFWQGLVILIFVVVLAEPDEKEDATARAVQYQNILICMEMLFFAIVQWCVFPAEEWEDGYQPKEMERPGLGIKDFVSDVGHIVQNRSGRSRRGRRKMTRRKANNNNIYPTGGMGTSQSSDFTGLYHQPGTAAAVVSQYDNCLNLGSFDDDDDDDDDDSNMGSVHDSDDGTNPNTNVDIQPLPSSSNQKSSVVRFGDIPVTSTISSGRLPPKHDGTHALNDSISTNESSYDGRSRTLSDGTAGNKADDELDSDLELL